MASSYMPCHIRKGRDRERRVSWRTGLKTVCVYVLHTQYVPTRLRRVRAARRSPGCCTRRRCSPWCCARRCCACRCATDGSSVRPKTKVDCKYTSVCCALPDGFKVAALKLTHRVRERSWDPTLQEAKSAILRERVWTGREASQLCREPNYEERWWTRVRTNDCLACGRGVPETYQRYDDCRLSMAC